MNIRPSPNPTQFNFQQTLRTRSESYYSTHTHRASVSLNTP